MLVDIVALIILGPILFVQGIYTRKVTPELEEPAGERTGNAGQGDALRLLVLGDSAAAGVGVEHQTHALSGKLVAKLAQSYQVDWRLEATTGFTTQDVLEKLEGVEPFEVDIIVVSLGVNDVTGLVSSKRWIKQQAQLREVLTGKFKAKRILFTNVPPMHTFPALPQPLRWYMGYRAKLFNSIMRREAESEVALEFIQVNFPMRPDYFADDGFHPGDKAYELWAETLLNQIREGD